MKRVLLILMLFSLCGCTSNLVCIKTQKKEYVTINQTMNIKFKNNIIKSAKFEIKADLISDYTSSKEFFNDLLINQFKTFKDNYGVDINVKETSKGSKLIMDLKKDVFEKVYGNGKVNMKKSDIRNNFENNGYVCK